MTDAPKNKKERKRSKTENKKTRTSVTAESDELVFAVCERFFNQLAPKGSSDLSANRARGKGAASAVSEWVRKERNRQDLNREKIYPLVWEALHRNFLLLCAPVEKDLRNNLIQKYELQHHLSSCGGDVVVTNVMGNTASKHVNTTAADLIVDLIGKINLKKKSSAIAEGKNPNDVRVHLGVGAGYAAMEVAKRLSNRAGAELPKLTLHAITPGGYYIAEQQKDTSTYFSYFVERSIDVECVGFFSTTVVMEDSYDSFKTNPSLRSCFERRDEIDIIVTSLASSSDPHGLMGQYFDYLKSRNLIEEDVRQTLENQAWVGDLLFQPYSPTKPIYPKTLRTVALFDFKELVQFSLKQDKYVVLCGGPCADCGAPKTEALKPLLTNPSLRAWTHLVLDREAARQLS